MRMVFLLTHSRKGLLIFQMLRTGNVSIATSENVFPELTELVEVGEGRIRLDRGLGLISCMVTVCRCWCRARAHVEGCNTMCTE